MKLARFASILLLATFAFTACDEGDDISGVVIADFAGFWNATQFSVNDETDDHPGFGIDAIGPPANGTVTLDVSESGSFNGTLDIPGLTPGTVPIGGTMSLIGDETLSIDFNATTESLFSDFEASYTLAGDVLTFVNDDMMFDFPDDIEQDDLGVTRGPVAASLTAQFERD